VIYDVKHRGVNEDGNLWLTGNNVLLIFYAMIATVGGAGIGLTSTSVKNLLQARKDKASFPVAEAVYIYSNTVTERIRDSKTNRERITTNYEYIYEYYVDGKRYECMGDAYFRHSSETPEEQNKKITIQYNPKKPEEIITTKVNISGIVAGILCCIVAALLIWGATKVDMNKKYIGTRTTIVR
jgi:hypothetical protein